VQDVVLALLAKEPSHGYQLRARLQEALGPVGEAMNAGQIYVTLGRLEKAGLVVCERTAGAADRPDRKVYALTPTGPQRIAGSRRQLPTWLIRWASSTRSVGRCCGG
jgi:DNA-binding PadR family transcriptional regulator